MPAAVLLAVLALCGVACASAPARSRRPAAAAKHGRADESAALVEQSLRRAGLRFGTDGSTRALWGYLSLSHRLVEPAEARPGDVIFFDVRGTSDEPACADHAGIVERVDGDGRIGFVEARGGRVRHSFAHPRLPRSRRGPDDVLLNSFLRPKRIDEPPGARHFAGEMICGVARVTRS